MCVTNVNCLTFKAMLSMDFNFVALLTSHFILFCIEPLNNKSRPSCKNINKTWTKRK